MAAPVSFSRFGSANFTTTATTASLPPGLAKTAFVAYRLHDMFVVRQPLLLARGFPPPRISETRTAHNYYKVPPRYARDPVSRNCYSFPETREYCWFSGIR